jgi:hypothetical protein
MRVIVFVLVLLTLAGFLVADGTSMYAAHKNAVDFSNRAAEQAAHAYLKSKGNEVVVQKDIQEMAAKEGVQLVGLSYHWGTTRWYEVTVKASGTSYLLKHLPYVKDHLAQQSTAVVHF